MREAELQVAGFQCFDDRLHDAAVCVGKDAAVALLTLPVGRVRCWSAIFAIARATVRRVPGAAGYLRAAASSDCCPGSIVQHTFGCSGYAAWSWAGCPAA